MTDEDRTKLDGALAKALAAAASAENAAEKARAQAAAASGDAAEVNARLTAMHAGRSDRLQEDLKAIPIVGRLLALSAKYFGLSLAIALATFLIVGPIGYPLLLSAYLSLAPANIREQYADVVAAPFLTKVINELIEKNDNRIDYIQHIPHSWSLNTSDRSPVYPLTLVRGQEFVVKIRTRPTLTVNCIANSPKLHIARDALAETDLFTLNLLSPAITKSVSGNEAEWVEIVGGAAVWKSVANSALSDPARAYIKLDKRKAEKIWPCFSSIDTDLLIIVQKSIKQTLPKVNDESTAKN